MKWLMILSLGLGVLAACNGSGASIDAPGPTCPEMMPGNFDRCTASPSDTCGYGAYRCVCSGAQGWLCSSCPDGFRDLACTPQTTCEWSDQERDCSCVCASNSRWDCTQDTAGTPFCPHAFDAGVP